MQGAGIIESIDIQEFQGDYGTTHVRHTIDYELGTAAKAGNFVTGSQADDKIKQGLQQAAQTVKQKLESPQLRSKARDCK